MKTLSYFLAKYGPDFLAKLPKYKTAKFGGEYVAIVAVDVPAFLVVIGGEGAERLVSVCQLDDFCL